MSTSLVPHRPPKSRLATILGWIALPWLLVLGLSADELVRVRGLLGPEPHIGLRILIALVVAAPFVLWWLSPMLYRLPGLGWLADRRPTSLTLDETGLTLRRGERTQGAAWDDVAQLSVLESGEFSSARLVLRDGTRISLPAELVEPRRADRTRTTLLDEIERYRPELSRAAQRRRQERNISLAIMGVVVALGLVGTYLLYGR